MDVCRSCMYGCMMYGCMDVFICVSMHGCIDVFICVSFMQGYCNLFLFCFCFFVVLSMCDPLEKGWLPWEREIVFCIVFYVRIPWKRGASLGKGISLLVRLWGKGWLCVCWPRKPQCSDIKVISCHSGSVTYLFAV
jgi:hypothetical protein